jgi:hypothetical protein
MYRLTLTRDDRSAMDWIGQRYSHGNALWSKLELSEGVEISGSEWDQEGDRCYVIPEGVAWDVAELMRQDDMTCIGGALTVTFTKFINAII